MSDYPDDPAWSTFKDQIHGMMSNLREDYETMKKDIVTKEKRLEEERAVLSNIQELQERTVTLNVGGRRYITTPKTLVEGAPESILAALFSKEYGVTLDENGEIFVDREGKYFHYIMEFIRDGICLLPDEEYIRLKVAKEAEYYRLDGLLKIIRIQYRVAPPQAIDLEDIDGILFLYVWGSGGGNSNREGRGGAGGFSWGSLQLSKVLSFDLKIVVGNFAGTGGFGGGGVTPTPTSSSYNTVMAGHGGGYSGIFREDEPLLIAGGGGGGGNRAEYYGGAGGGERGVDGNGPDTSRTGKGGGQTTSTVDGTNSYGGRITTGIGAGSMRGGDGGVGSYDSGAGGGGGYFGGGGGGEGGGIDGPPGGGGSGYLHPDLEDAGTVAGNQNNCHAKATEHGYQNNGASIGRVVAEWESSNGLMRCEFKTAGEFRLTPLSFQKN
jgi:hypothetical protein